MTLLNTRREFVLGSAGALLAANAQAQALPSVVERGPAELPLTDEFVIRSKAGREYLIQVSARPAGQKYPTIFALDGNSAFPLMVSQTGILINAGLMRPANLVAIGYVDAFDQPDATGRLTDYAHLKGTFSGTTLGGGGEAFETFLVEELKPTIEARYPAEPDQAVLFGHSIGGLFAATVFCNRPRAFAGYLCSSPSIQFDPALPARAVAVAAAAEGRRMFVSVGDQEIQSLRIGCSQLATAISAPGSKVISSYRVFEGESHTSVRAVMAREALPFLLPKV